MGEIEEGIARVCHDANRAVCIMQNDNSQHIWEEAPAWQRESAINGVRFHLESLHKGETPSPSASHESWLKEKRETGWKYGPVKDPEKKEHPCCVPYNALPAKQRVKDYVFGAIVEAFYRAGTA